jgi:metallo-beta-lactamase family protein
MGRTLVDGAKSVRIFGEDVAVRSRIWTINGFSSHADQPILLDWLGKAQPRQVFLVHGEPASLEGFRKEIRSTLSIDPHVAVWKETVSV